MNWFTSDWHIGHKNILGYDDRPWDTVEEMNEGILENLNRLVNKGDTVYYLGDWAFNIEQGIDILNRVNGKWVFIKGNHDKNLPKIIEGAEKEVKFAGDLLEVSINGTHITLCHYPMISWNRSHYGSWQLFGHHHKKDYREVPGTRLNVALSLNSYKPWNFEEIKEYMKNREVDLGR